MDSKTPYLARCIASLPSDFAPKVQALCLSNSTEIVLDTLIRFISGAECSVDASSDTIQEWSAKQRVAKESLNDLIQAVPNGNKRQREQDELDEHNTKRQKVPSPEPQPADDPPVFTLHSISTTSPIRKKSDITIHRSSIKFTNIHATCRRQYTPLIHHSRLHRSNARKTESSLDGRPPYV